MNYCAVLVVFHLIPSYMFSHLPAGSLYILSELLPPSVLPSFLPFFHPSFLPSFLAFLPSYFLPTPKAISRSQRALPGLNRERQIAVGTARPQPRTEHCRTSTTSSRCQRALPDLNCEISVGTAGPQPRAQDCSGHCRT